MRFRFALLTGGLVSLLLGLPTQTQAAGLLINVQFQDNLQPLPQFYTGAAVIGSAGDQWNALYGFDQSLTPLIDSAGNPTSVKFSNAADPMGMGVTTSGTFSDPTGSAFPSPLNDLMGSYAFSDATAWFPNTFSFSGLTPGSAYDLYIYSQGDTAANGRQLTVSINGAPQTTNPSDANASTFILNQNYLFFDDILADVNGIIEAGWYSAANEANINGFQLRQSTAPPVPGPLPLLGAAAAFRVSRRLRARINQQLPGNNQPPV